MTSVEERLAHLEGRMQEQSEGFPELRRSIVHLDAKVSDSIARLDAKVSESIARLDAKVSDSIGRLDAKLTDNTARLDDKMSSNIARLEDKMSRYFVWLVGMWVTVLAGVVAGLVSR